MDIATIISFVLGFTFLGMAAVYTVCRVFDW